MPQCPFTFTVSFFGEGSPTKTDYRKKGTLILASLLEHLDWVLVSPAMDFGASKWLVFLRVSGGGGGGSGFLDWRVQGSAALGQLEALGSIGPNRFVQNGLGQLAGSRGGFRGCWGYYSSWVYLFYLV